MMKQLKELVDRQGAKTRPVDSDSVRGLEVLLGFSLSQEYKCFLTTFGVIVFGGAEIYGLGVPDTYYLNVGNCYADLSRDPKYPSNAVPVFDAGDGHYYLYDNSANKVIHWATPNGGIVEILRESLETYLIKQLFHVG